MKILGIETSCDETAAAVVNGNGRAFDVLSNIVSSQIEMHKEYGGVIPEMAAREHVKNILPVIDEALIRSGISRNSAGVSLDAVAVTAGPGLITSLQVGVETAKALSFSWKIPLVSVNHIEGHIYSNFIKTAEIEFPAVILTVSGGHNLLLLMKGHGQIEKLGETRDDAAGEAFDKAAKLMGLGYPGGPAISKAAEAAGKNFNINLPRPMIKSDNFDFSFSGLKTALYYELKKNPGWEKFKNEYSREFQSAIIDVLVSKTIAAAVKFKANTVMLSGGVSANKALRQRLEEESAQRLPKSGFRVPDPEYTTDNAAMIAVAGHYKAEKGDFSRVGSLKADCNLGFRYLL